MNVKVGHMFNLTYVYFVRTSILREIELEEQHRKWYYDQLEALAKKIESLPLSEPVSTTIFLLYVLSL